MAAMPASVQGQAARMLCLLVIIAIHAPSCTPVFVEAASGSAEEGTRQLSPCFVPALSIHHNRLAAFSCPAAAFRTTLDRLYAPAAFPIQERGRMLRSRHVLRRLSDKDKQDMPQEDRAKEEEAAKKEEEEKEVFWMFETEKNFREELKAPTLLRVEFDNYDVEGLVKWVQSYPFAAVLPVQPLMVQPTEDGCDVLFRKKPTKERGAIDGGLRVCVEEVTSITWDPHRWPKATRNKEESVYSEAVGAEGTGRKAGSETEDPQRCTLKVTRIAEGQMVEKKFSEKLIIQRMLKELRSEDFKHGRALSSFANDLSAPKGPTFPDPR